MKVCGKDLKVRGRLIRIACLDSDGYESLHDPQAVLDGLRQSGIRVDLFTFMQIMPETQPKYGYPMEWDNLAVLPVSTFDDWWKNQIRSLSRNRARQAEKKGVTLREVALDDSFINGIWQIYNECPVRQGRPFPHYGKDAETVHKMIATFADTSIFIGAFLENRLIGFAKLTCDPTGAQANLMSILSMIQHRDKAPANALIAQAVRSCAERGIAHLVYQRFSYGRRQRDSLSDFKENNGFRRVDVPRYYIPLSRMGRAALRFGMHHRMTDRFPGPVLAKLRGFRTAWYARKRQTSHAS